MKLKVNITNAQTGTKIPFGTKYLVRKACITTLIEENFPNNAEVDVTIVDDEQIKEYNNAYRNIDKSTDVLSFPLGDNGEYDINPQTGNAMLGDIVISIEHALAQADLFGHGLRREIGYLTVHSMLHLLGYDHVNNDEEKAVMRSKEEIILKKIGLEITKEN
ncbi:MAG: rRNA maturation RNase YbeY [Clostridia bacterium]|nr:rRNA maturation RNase YbeY [Clostridia bacterium]